MNRSSLALCAFVAVTLPGVAYLSAQSSVRTTQSAQPSVRPSAAAAKAGNPDPDLFDGSKHEAEKRPDRGMLAEFELPGGERPSQKVGGPSGEAGGGGAQREQSAMAAGRGGATQNDPNAKAEGASAENLQVPDGAQAAQSDAAESNRPQEVSLGDAAMQIQTAANQQNAVGGQQQAAQSTQQYEKGAASGNQRGDRSGGGVERGKVVPQGL